MEGESDHGRSLRSIPELVLNDLPGQTHHTHGDVPHFAAGNAGRERVEVLHRVDATGGWPATP